MINASERERERGEKATTKETLKNATTIYK